MLVNDGVVEKAFVEDGFGDNIGDDPFEVSDALTMFNYVTTDSPVGRQLTLNLEERLNSRNELDHKLAKRIVMVSGGFDPLHGGHINLLESVKNLVMF